MGFTSQTFYINTKTTIAYLENKVCTETSNIEYLNRTGFDVKRFFDTLEVCDNNKVVLRNSNGEFVVLQ